MKKIITLAFVAATALTGTACQQDPCLKVGPPSAELIRIAQDPKIEVDYVLDEKTECDMVVSGNTARWQRESD